MSTAIDYKAMLRQAKGAKKATSTTSDKVPFSASDKGQSPSGPDKGFLMRPVNRDSLVNQYQVSPEGLNRAFYVPEFISQVEEAFMLSKIYSSEDRPAESASKWVQLSHRRLKVYGGTPDSQGTHQRPLPAWIDDFLIECIEPFLAATPPLDETQKTRKADHVLLNEYSEGMGIGAHFDGPLYHERVLVMNLQSPATIYFYSVNENTLVEAFSLVLEPRSLLIFEGSLYNEFKHGIPNATHDDLTGKNAPQNWNHLSEPVKALLAAGHPLARGELPRLSLTLRSIRHQSTTSEADIVTGVEKENLRRAEVNFYRNVSELN